MRKLIWIAAMGLGLSGAYAQSPQGALLTNSQTGGPLSTGWWLKVYGGLDYSMMGDLVNGTKAWQSPLQNAGYNPTLSTGNLGFLDGTEVGFSLDPDHSLSFEAQNTSTQSDSYSYIFSGSTYTQSVTPYLLDFSLNFYRTLYRGGGTKTYLMIGGGYYHAAVDYYSGSNPSNSQAATFTGDIIGGTLGLGELVAVGGNFVLGLSVKGRLATFSQVDSSSIVDDGTTLTQHAPYALMISNSKPLAGALSAASPGFVGNNFRYAAVDYSGVSGQLSIAYHF